MRYNKGNKNKYAVPGAGKFLAQMLNGLDVFGCGASGYFIDFARH